MDAQIFNFLFPVIQEAHVGRLRSERHNVVIAVASFALSLSLFLQKVSASPGHEEIPGGHLHADAAHHLVRDGQVAVGGKGGGMSRLQLDVEQVHDVAWNPFSSNTSQVL